MNITVNTLLLTHIFGCLWFLIARYDGFSEKSWVIGKDNSIISLYITSIYWAMQTVSVVGYGDIPPCTPTESTFAVIWMLIGTSFYSFTIGNI